MNTFLPYPESLFECSSPLSHSNYFDTLSPASEPYSSESFGSSFFDSPRLDYNQAGYLYESDSLPELPQFSDTSSNEGTVNPSELILYTDEPFNPPQMITAPVLHPSLRAPESFDTTDSPNTEPASLYHDRPSSPALPPFSSPYPSPSPSPTLSPTLSATITVSSDDSEHETDGSPNSDDSLPSVSSERHARHMSYDFSSPPTVPYASLRSFRTSSSPVSSHTSFSSSGTSPSPDIPNASISPSRNSSSSDVCDASLGSSRSSSSPDVPLASLRFSRDSSSPDVPLASLAPLGSTRKSPSPTMSYSSLSSPRTSSPSVVNRRARREASASAPYTQLKRSAPRNVQCDPDVEVDLDPKAIDPKTLVCPICHKKQKSKRLPDLRRHMKTHKQSEEWVCCGERIGPTHPLYNHPNTFEYNGGKYIGGCGRVFTRKDALGRHFRNPNNTCIPPQDF